MSEKELEVRFLEAVEIASQMTQSSLPQDVQLRLYAYYKQATFGTIGYNNSSNFDLSLNSNFEFISTANAKPEIYLA
jgi:acyl-CoA-binding protein